MLAKAGWFSGNPSTILSAPVDVVMNAYYYEIMSRDFETTSIEMNKAKK